MQFGHLSLEALQFGCLLLCGCFCVVSLLFGRLRSLFSSVGLLLCGVSLLFGDFGTPGGVGYPIGGYRGGGFSGPTAVFCLGYLLPGSLHGFVGFLAGLADPLFGLGDGGVGLLFGLRDGGFGLLLDFCGAGEGGVSFSFGVLLGVAGLVGGVDGLLGALFGGGFGFGGLLHAGEGFFLHPGDRGEHLGQLCC